MAPVNEYIYIYFNYIKYCINKKKEVINYVSKSNAVIKDIKYLYSLKKIRIQYTNF